MNTIDHFGQELVLKPITKVRIRNHDKKWYVEYSIKKWIFNFWVVEGNYKDFVDAKARAIVLRDQGGVFQLQNVQLEWTIGDQHHDDHPIISDGESNGQ